MWTFILVAGGAIGLFLWIKAYILPKNQKDVVKSNANKNGYHFNVYLIGKGSVTKEIENGVFKKVNRFEVEIYRKKLSNIKGDEEFMTSYIYDAIDLKGMDFNYKLDDKLVECGIKKGDQYSVKSSDDVARTFFSTSNKLW